jgi:uncharacterized protein YhaN
MRIAQLDLKAWGHFTDRRLRFNDGPDFHLAYGPNEAGKTTISRALHAALFGVPERTLDSHLHAYGDLRVGVVLENAGGRLAAMRRKARRNSLVRYDPETGDELGQAIVDAELANWLGGLGQGLFASMFGIDHEGLIGGGRELAEGRGEVGQSLFSAGAGLASVKALKDRLAQEADVLFRPRASSSAIYKTIEAYNDARREVRDLQARPSDWDALRKRAEEAEREYRQLRDRQDALQRETRRLERLAALLPDVARRAQAQEHLAGMGEVARLEPDSSNARISAEARLRDAQQARAVAEENIARLRSELEAIELPESLLTESGAIESLYYTLGVFREARDGAAVASSRLKQAEERAMVLLAAIGETMREDIRSVIPSATLRARVQSMVSRGSKVASESEAARQTAIDARKEVQELDNELNQLGSTEVPLVLAGVLAEIDTQGNPEVQAAELAAGEARANSALEREVATFSNYSIGDLLAMRTPLSVQLQNFRNERSTLEARRSAQWERIQGLENDIAAVQGDIKGLLLAGEVLTDEQLDREREIRDGLWQRIRRNVYLEPGEDFAKPPLPPVGEYEAALRTADNTADRRFVEAARITQHTELEKRLTQMRNVLKLHAGRLAEADCEMDQLGQRWQSFVADHGLPELDIDELADWLSRREFVLQRHQACSEKKAASQQAASMADALRERLSQALTEVALPPCASNESLAGAIKRVRDFVEKVNANASSQSLLTKRRKTAGSRLADAEERLRESELALQTWQGQWVEAMRAICLDEHAEAAETAERLRQFEELEKSLDIIDREKAELSADEKTVNRVEAEIERLAQATGFARGNMPADGAVEMLHGQLVSARKLSEHRNALRIELNEAERTGKQAAQSIRETEQQLKGLMDAAGCSGLHELAEAERRSAECLGTEAEIAAIEDRLVTGSGMTLAECLTQTQGQDLAMVRASLDHAAQDLDMCRSQAEEAHGKLLAARTAFQQVNGEAAAAQAEQEAAEASARLTTLIGDYSGVRLAFTILGEVIEAWQQRHQGPMLARASQTYETITGGRFARITTDFEEDKTVLLAVRADGKRLTVDKLSSGRRDQLFLALRLAAIESHVSAQEPMPVVLDDILINFDDDASSATFKVLADLSKRTQILFFTHHRHLVGRAEKAIGAGAFVAHSL